MYRDNQKRKDWERQYYLKNRKIKIEYAKNRYKCNKEELLGRQKIYERERYSISRIYKQLYYLRNREIILSRQRKNILTLLKQNERQKQKSKKRVIELDDKYIASLIVRSGSKKSILDNLPLIEVKRQIVILKREIKKHDKK